MPNYTVLVVREDQRELVDKEGQQAGRGAADAQHDNRDDTYQILSEVPPAWTRLIQLYFGKCRSL